MIKETSAILVTTIRIFMERIQTTSLNYEVHQDVRECSLLFKEHSYGQRKWYVDIPSSGMANMLPHFTFSAQDASGAELERAPEAREIETWIFKIM
jgi:hypothetical protein